MIIKIMKNDYYQASLRLDMIIKVMKNNMIIKVMKNNDYQASPRLNMIIKVRKKWLSSKSGTWHDN